MDEMTALTAANTPTYTDAFKQITKIFKSKAKEEVETPKAATPAKEAETQAVQTNEQMRQSSKCLESIEIGKTFCWK
jgi:hypothetical protein